MNNKNGFHVADAPIGSASVDKLARANFARRLARILTRASADQSLVVSLEGSWGDGKSSVKNMVLEELAADSSESPTVLEFSPWHWRDNEQLSQAFFREVRIAIGRASEGASTFARWTRLRKFGEYSRLLLKGSDLIAEFEKALPTVAGFVAAGGLFAAGMNSASAGWLGSNGVWLGALLAFLVLCFRFFATALSVLAVHPERGKTTEEIREMIRSDLTKLTKRILIIIDDIDRLTSAEIRLMIQHVKSNADFPNVVFFLLFDRAVVERALAPRDPTRGRRYLEKIVHVQIAVPRAEEFRLEQLLVHSLNEAAGDFAEKKHGFDSGRWANLLAYGVRPCIQNVRNVNRLAANVAVTFSALRTRSALEVNPIDLIGIQVIQVFEPDLFAELPENKGVLTGQASPLSKGDQKNQTLDRLMALVSPQRQDGVRNILTQLFPPIVSTSKDDEWTADRRVCSFEFFDRYFFYAVAANDITHSEFSELVNSASVQKEFRRYIRTLESRGLLALVLRRLNYYKQRLPINSVSEFLPVLVDVGDRANAVADSYSISAFRHASGVVEGVLERIENLEQRSQHLLFLIRNTHGLAVIGSILNDERDRRKRTREPPLFEDSMFETAKELWIEKVRSAANDGSLSSHPLFAFIWWRWLDLDHLNEAADWLQSITTNTDENLLRFLDSFSTIATLHRGNAYEEKERRFDLRSLETFVDIEKIAARIETMNLSDLSLPQRECVEAFRLAYGRRATARSGDTP